MRIKTITVVCVALIALAIGIQSASAGRKNRKKAARETPLTEVGQKLQMRYTGMLTELKAVIAKALPTLDRQKKPAYLKARRAETVAVAGLKAAQRRMGEINRARALVGHAKGKWIGGADRGIAAAKAKLKRANTKAKRLAAQRELVKWQDNRKAGVAALKERQAALDKAERERPQIERESKRAQEVLARANAATLKAVENLGLKSFLSNNKLDATLAKCVVLLEATPRGLAAFAQQSKEHEKTVEHMLANDDLLVQMVVAEGAMEGNYGQAMKIYKAIQKASAKARTGALQRLALAVSLEHAVPVAQRNAKSKTDAPAVVDPVKRYLHFERAFLNDELDAGFKNLSVWDYRMVVDGNEPDEILTWGRKMLRNYRPDHITTADYRWRYVGAVRTEIRYGSQHNKYDKDNLQFFQNILMNGGVCGRRAFFGRFMLRAFGVPTTARPQRGHAALVHWTPDGWVVCLGAGWGHGWVRGRKSDLDFLAITQARAAGNSYMQVKRALLIGDIMGEKRTFGFRSGDPAFWNSVALYTQRAIIENAEPKTPSAVRIVKATLTESDRTVVVDKSGVITIPASATSKPAKSTGKIIFMPSNLGGKQLHYSRTGRHQSFEYTFDAPAAGKYALTARVVTPSWKQYLFLSVNGAAKPIDIALPFTVGRWDTTEPVEVTLEKGRNVLRFSRMHENVKGVTIRDFTLRPVK